MEEELEKVGRVWFGDNFEIQKDGNEVYFVFWFPEKKITNSKGQEHTMLDVGFSITFSINYDGTINFTDIQYFRKTITYLEYLASYGFSHGSNGIHGGSLCFGSGPINHTRGLMYEHNWVEFNVDLFEMLIFQLECYLGWESLEGGPYKKIASIGAKTTQSYVDGGRVEYYKDYLPKEAYKLKFRELDFNYFELDEQVLKKHLTLIAKPIDLAILHPDTGEILGLNPSVAEQLDLISNLSEYTTVGCRNERINIISVDVIQVEGEKGIIPLYVEKIKSEVESNINQWLYNELKN